MSPRTFAAPGKVVVVGEYAVLDGAPAIVAAVDLGVRCTVTPASRLTTSSDVGDTTFVDAALAAVQAPAAQYAFHADPLPPLEGKPGLGGSAAATVVACLAGVAMRGHTPEPAELFRTAYAVHHAVQGSGSGIDVAASTYGGVSRYLRGQPPTPLPPVDLTVVYSGASAKTGPRVEAYRAWAHRAPFVTASQVAVDTFATQPIEALRNNARLLRQMADGVGLHYATPALDHIAALATRHGGAAKPSGAGGGDCAVALLPGAEARAAFVTACNAEGLVVLSTGVAQGAREV